MNAVFVLVGAVFFLFLGYKYYKKILNNLFNVDNNAQTPAYSKKDNCDYVPSKHWTILFGHHFSSIAGAGPIVGPIIAVSIWGWGAAILWIIIGAVLIGGVHDYGSLMVSIKNNGVSLADVSKNVISKRAKFIFGIFLWITLILIDAVFIIFAGKTFVSQPGVALPAFGLIPVAILVGYLLYRKNVKKRIATPIGLVLLLALLLLGPMLPVNAGPIFWSSILLIYAFFASVVPVNILLQPRDYLASYLLFAGILFGFVGVFVLQPNFSIPVFQMPRNIQPLWPMLFVTVACGAVSGFHSIVASGTTSKQLAQEKEAYRIGYGSMIMEAVLAVVAIIAVAAALGVGETISFVSSNNPIGAFGAGYGKLTQSFLGGYGSLFALMILNAFILTTLDTSTRITRYLTEELFGIKNKYISTSIVIAIAGFIAFTGSGNKIWPVFGAANQLVAALSLIVISAWLLQKGKNAVYTLIPMGIMLVTSVGALVYQANMFISSGKYMLFIISLILVVLAAVLVWETVQSYRKITLLRLHKINKHGYSPY